ncbi:MAG: hypothetical protein Q7J85_06340 [Bacillota bacterium]|nr:hypothetical protein [Bacillota bacterium]
MPEPVFGVCPSQSLDTGPQSAHRCEDATSARQKGTQGDTGGNTGRFSRTLTDAGFTQASGIDKFAFAWANSC